MVIAGNCKGEAVISTEIQGLPFALHCSCFLPWWQSTSWQISAWWSATHLICLIAGQPNFYIPEVVATLNTRIFKDPKDIKSLNHWSKGSFFRHLWWLFCATIRKT